MRFVEPTTLREACTLLAQDEWGSVAISGGTALVLMMRQGLVAPDTVVSIAGIAGLEGISMEGDRLRIGARTTHSSIANSPDVQHHLPSLAEACRRVGNVRVRNVGTIGGNLAEADYASDPPTVLLSLRAVCEVAGPEGTRELPVEELATGFYTTSLRAGEIITAIWVGLRSEHAYAYERFVSRSSEDRPCVGVAAMARIGGSGVEELSLVVGAVAAKPLGLDDVTDGAMGRPLDDGLRREIAAAAADAIDPIEDIRGSAWYRRQITASLVRRVLERVSP